MKHSESTESPAEEYAESSKEEASEVAEGTEIPLPEKFQRSVQSLLKGANKQQLRHVQDCCNECLDGMAKEEREEEFSTKDMPS